MRNDDNRFYAAGNNQGAKAATGRWLCLLNSDTEVRPGALDRLVDFLEANGSSYGACAPRLVNPDGSVQKACKRFPGLMVALCFDSFWGSFWPGKWVEDRYLMRRFDHLESCDVAQPPGAVFCMDREEYLALGGLDEQLYLFYNDVDLCKQLADKGRKIRYLADAEVMHHEGASTSSHGGLLVTWVPKPDRVLPQALRGVGHAVVAVHDLVARRRGTPALRSALPRPGDAQRGSPRTLEVLSGGLVSAGGLHTRTASAVASRGGELTEPIQHLFPPLLPKDPLRGPVLVLAAHPDDEVIGAGGMLAWHRQQGHAVTVLHMTDGAQGDPDGRVSDIQRVRRQEGIEALRRLDKGGSSAAARPAWDLRHWDLPDGALPEHREAVVERLTALVREVRPQTLYSFFFNEAHRDHRLVAHATADVAEWLPDDCRCLLYGVNQVPSGGTLFDTTAEYPAKRHALGAYESQLAYIDFAAFSHHRDVAATVNVGDPSIEHAELFADLRPAQLPRVRDLADALYRLLQGESE